MDREPNVTRFIKGPWDDAKAHRAFIEQRTLGPYPSGMGYWTITPIDAPDSFLGWVLLIPADAHGSDIEIGWRLRPFVWGRGYASEAARRVLSYALDELSLPLVIAEIHPENAASIRIAEKLGMRQVDRSSAKNEDILFVFSKNEFD